MDILFPRPDRLPNQVQERLDEKTIAARRRERWVNKIQKAFGHDIDQNMEQFVEAVKVRHEEEKKR